MSRRARDLVIQALKKGQTESECARKTIGSELPPSSGSSFPIRKVKVEETDDVHKYQDGAARLIPWTSRPAGNENEQQENESRTKRVARWIQSVSVNLEMEKDVDGPQPAAVSERKSAQSDKSIEDHYFDFSDELPTNVDDLIPLNLFEAESELREVVFAGETNIEDPPLLQTLDNLFNDRNEIVLEVLDNAGEDSFEILPHQVLQEPQTPANRSNKKSTRKRSCTPAEWKHKKAKKALDSGVDHLNVKGIFKPGKKLKPACVCKMKCSLKITEDERLAVHKMFWNYLADKTRQWEYIYNHSPTTAKSRTITESENSRRSNSRKYYLGILDDNNKEKCRVRVCKLMFTNTLTIGDGVIVTAHKHSVTGSTTPDKRGKHGNRPNKASETHKESIRMHINSFPRVPAHYVRAKCQREYVECGLSINKMARHYKLWCIHNNIPEKDRGTCNMYRVIVNTEFNIGFFKPKKDQCQLCNMFKNSPRAQRESVLKEKWIAHIRSKAAAYEAQKKARKLLTQRRNVAMCTFDLQKVLPCPRSETSVFFYKNKLSVYNLTVYDVKTHVGKCYLWHAGIAMRGANDIGSCVYNQMLEYARQGIEEVHSFSDSCSGQNRNRFIYAMLLLASAKFSIKIRHTFLEPGHTYNEGDSVHAMIEKAAKRKEIFDLKEWIELIKTAKVKAPFYEVKVLKRSDFFNFKDLVSKQNWDKSTQGRKITWSKVKIVEAGFDAPGIISCQYSYDGAKVYLDTSQRRGHPMNLKTYEPPCAYQETIPLKAKTVRHLKELCDKKDIPVRYHEFYKQIIEGVEPTEEDYEADDPQILEDSHDPDAILDDDGFLEDGLVEDEENGNEKECSDDEESNSDNNSVLNDDFIDDE